MALLPWQNAHSKEQILSHHSPSCLFTCRALSRQLHGAHKLVMDWPGSHPCHISYISPRIPLASRQCHALPPLYRCCSLCLKCPAQLEGWQTRSPGERFRRSSVSLRGTQHREGTFPGLTRALPPGPLPSGTVVPAPHRQAVPARRLLLNLMDD